MTEIPDLGSAAGEATYGEDWLFPVGPIMPSPTIPVPVGPAGGTARPSGTVTVPGAAVPIRVPPPCVAVPALSTPQRSCAGVDSTGFAGIAEVANFAGKIADCYANRMAQRRQRERQAKAQDQAEAGQSDEGTQRDPGSSGPADRRGTRRGPAGAGRDRSHRHTCEVPEVPRGSRVFVLEELRYLARMSVRTARPARLDGGTGHGDPLGPGCCGLAGTFVARPAYSAWS